MSGPFAALSLPARPDLTDAQVRTAWRQIAAATHPDRADGGDPSRYAAASAAYAVLRTPWGRSEAYADLAAAVIPRDRVVIVASVRAAGAERAGLGRSLAILPARVARGRPRRLAARIAAAAALAVLVLHSGAGTPPIAGLITGLVTWLALTARGDLAPPPGR